MGGQAGACRPGGHAPEPELPVRLPGEGGPVSKGKGSRLDLPPYREGDSLSVSSFVKWGGYATVFAGLKADP